MPKEKSEKKPRKQLLPQRFLNTAVAKMTAGPDEFEKRREASPGKFLSDEELKGSEPGTGFLFNKKKKKGAADELLKDKK